MPMSFPSKHHKSDFLFCFSTKFLAKLQEITHKLQGQALRVSDNNLHTCGSYSCRKPCMKWLHFL